MDEMSLNNPALFPVGKAWYELVSREEERGGENLHGAEQGNVRRSSSIFSCNSSLRAPFRHASRFALKLAESLASLCLKLVVSLHSYAFHFAGAQTIRDDHAATNLPVKDPHCSTSFLSHERAKKLPKQ